MLSFLKQQLKPASEEGAPWSWLSKGAYGSLCIQRHTEQNSWSVKVFPRTRVTDFRTLTMNDGEIKIFDKNRALRYLPEEEVSYIQNQVKTLALMSELFTRVSPFVITSAMFQGSLYRRKYTGRDDSINTKLDS